MSASNGAPILELQDVASRRGGVPVLREISIEVGSEIVALVGLNGSGKSTLLRTISGLTPTTHGTITLGGAEIQGKSGHEIARLGIGYIQQSNQFFPNLTVEENLELGGYLLGRRGAKQAAEEQLAQFPRLAERRKAKAAALSGGERQMLALARTLARKPKLLLIDELSAGLAPNAVADSYELVKSLGIPILLAEQNVSKALEVADRVLVMFLGTIRRTVPAKGVVPEHVEYVRGVMLGEQA